MGKRLMRLITVNIKTWKETACNYCPLREGCIHIAWWADEGKNFPARCLDTLISRLKDVIRYLDEAEKKLDKLKKVFEEVFPEEEYW